MKKIDIQGEMDTSQPMDALDKLQKKMDETKEKAGDAPKEAKKDWLGLANLFSSVLPRNLQGLIRGFQGKERSVKRLGVSFKFLKTQLAALGLPLLLMLIEKIIENWDTLARAMSGTTEGMVAFGEAVKAGNEAVDDFIRANETAYKSVLNNKASVDDLAVAYKELGKEIDIFRDLNAASESDQRRAQNVMTDHLGLLKDETTARELLAQIKEYETKGERAWYDIFSDSNEERKESLKTMKESYAAMQVNIRVQQQLLDAERERIAGEKKLAEEAERERQQKEKDAEKARERAIAEAQRKREERAKLSKELDREEELAALEGLDRIMKEIEFRRQDALAEAREIEATREQIAQINARYDAEESQAFWDAFERAQEDRKQAEEIEVQNREQRFKDEQEAIRDQHDAIAQIEKALEDEDDPLVKLENEAMRIAMHYEELFALAEKYNLDVVELERQMNEDLAAINKKYIESTTTSRLEGLEAMESGARKLMGGIEDIAKEGGATQKALAVTSILLDQGKAMASAIAGATSAAAATGPGAPLALAGYIASMVGTVLSSFVSIKKILSQAGASSRGIGGGGGGASGGGTAVQALVPTMPDQTPQIQLPPIETFVVQSNLQGMQLQANQMGMRSSL